MERLECGQWRLCFNAELIKHDPKLLHAKNHKGETAARTPLQLAGYPFGSHRQVQTYADKDITRIIHAPYGRKSITSGDKDYVEDDCAVQDLLNRGVDATVRDTHGDLPFFLAAATGHQLSHSPC